MNENAIKLQHLKILHVQKFYDSFCTFKKDEGCSKKRSSQGKFMASLDKLSSPQVKIHFFFAFFTVSS